MIKHMNTESTNINFSKLKKRIIAINDPILGKFNGVREMIKELVDQNRPILIMATGGSKVIAYYLQFIIERLSWNKIICEVIEVRDYFYKVNRDSFSNLVVFSASGRTNGVEEALKDFKGRKYLVCEKEKETDYNVVSWGNEVYEQEKSFISLATTLGPMALLLDYVISLSAKIDSNKIQQVNDKIAELIIRSENKINSLQLNFKDISLIQIMSGYETRTASYALESSLVEGGLLAPVLHDKGSFCHGRSNLLFNYPNSLVVYLTHELKDLDRLIIETIDAEYASALVFNTSDMDDDIFWREYYLTLQMYFLAKLVADDKNIDLTRPEYNPRLVRNLYNYRGEM